MSLSNQNPFPSSQVCVMNLEVISSLLVTHWVWFAINTLKVRAYLILWLIICTLLCPSLHEIFPGISNFLKEISSLQHSIVFLYFFALITEEAFLISPFYSLELCIQMGLSFLFSFAFCIFFFSQLPVRPPQAIILPFCISFSWICS